jgi:hypothetical protein
MMTVPDPNDHPFVGTRLLAAEGCTDSPAQPSAIRRQMSS